MKTNPFYAVILAAGNSGRMGRDKFLLSCPGGHNFLTHITQNYLAYGCRSVVAVLPAGGKKKAGACMSFDPRQLITIENPDAELGRAHSLRLALKALPGPAPVFVHNVDNPFLDHRTLDMLAGKLKEGGYVRPLYQGQGGHPIILSATLAAHIAVNLRPGTQMNTWLKQFPQTEVEVNDPGVLVNINTPEDYHKHVKNLSE